MGLFQREPTAVIGTVVTVAVAAYAKWQGLEVEDVLVQVGALAASFVAIRSRVTPYVKGALDEVSRLRGVRGENDVL